MRFFKRRRKRRADTVPVVMQKGRWTYHIEGETPSQAVRRLEAGGPDVEEYTYGVWGPHFKPALHGENGPDSRDAS